MIKCKRECEAMNISNTRTISFRVDEDFHTAVKLQAVKEKKTLQEYVIETLKKDLDEKAKK
jgi:predicted HicB family RNase H-like nuclease